MFPIVELQTSRLQDGAVEVQHYGAGRIDAGGAGPNDIQASSAKCSQGRGGLGSSQPLSYSG